MFGIHITAKSTQDFDTEIINHYFYLHSTPSDRRHKHSPHYSYYINTYNLGPSHIKYLPISILSFLIILIRLNPFLTYNRCNLFSFLHHYPQETLNQTSFHFHFMLSHLRFLNINQTHKAITLPTKCPIK